MNDQFPLLSTSTEPDATTLLLLSVISTATVRPGSPLPVIVGVVSVVRPSSSINNSGATKSMPNTT